MTPATTHADLSHEAVLELLPQLAGGHLPAVLRQQLEVHLEGCADCAREWRFEQQLAAAWRAEPAAPRSPEPALQALLARIERDGAPSRPPVASPARWLRGWLAGMLEAPGPRLALAGFAAVAAGLLLLRDAPDLRSASPGYHVLASPAPDSRAADAAGRLDLLLAFAPDVSAARRAALLASIGAVEIGAPNSAGAIRVRSAQIDSPERLSAALMQLRTQPEILFAEPAELIARERPQ